MGKREAGTETMISRRTVLARIGTAALPGAAFAQKAPLELVLTPMNKRTLRVRLAPAGGTAPEDPVIVAKATAAPIFRAQSFEAPREVKWGSLRIRVSGSPVTVAVEDAGGKKKQEIRFDEGGIAFRAGARPLFGLGEGGPQYDRRGHEYTMRNGQYNPEQRVEGGRAPIPWIVSPEGWAIFFHQPFGVTDLRSSEGRFRPSQPDAPIDLFLLFSSEPAGLLAEYADLTGHPHMPPLWSLGYLQSHRTLASREEILGEAATFREKKLPCDAMIYLGTGFCPSGWNTGHGSFEFNKNVFPDPATMIGELHREHFRVILHLTTPPEKLSGRVSDAGDAARDVNNAAHYWATHREVFGMGVDGWWPDEGDPLDVPSRFARNRLYWEGPLRDRPDVRPFALHRNGYAGVQRFGWLWSGDVNSDWKAFAAQIPVAINTGLTGMPWWGSDTGGFIPTLEYTGELFVRWFQFSAFCTQFRSHGRTWKLHLPWGWNTGDYGPIEVNRAQLTDESNLHDARVEPICRQYLDLRYQLLPYLYAAVREAHDSGMPVVRAMWLHYPDDAAAVERGDQYLWGRDILVAPVIAPGAKTRRLYLPRGAWYDFWTGERAEGGREIERAVDLATLPLYVRAGAIVPFGPVKQFTSEKVDEPMRIRVYPGADGEFALYEDDGISFAYERGEFMRIAMRWDERARQLRLSLVPGSRMLSPAVRTLEIENARGGAKKRIEFRGGTIRLSL
jgi:alpha-glucosidase/alpha-D-xyloside xylohydrolase